jgi:hypothetical protein
VATEARELQQSASLLAKLFGAELEAMHKHIELADAGYTFLTVYSPTDLETKRVMNVARRFRYELAQKYDRFSITELQARACGQLHTFPDAQKHPIVSHCL